MTGETDESFYPPAEKSKEFSFIARLTELLKENNLTRAKFLSDLGFGKNQFTYWEKNQTLPNNSTLNSIAMYFGVSVEYLTGYTDTPDSTIGLDFGTTYSAAITGLDTIPVGKRGKRPVYGKVGAGEGAFAEDHIVGWESVDEKYDNDDYFYLRVQGSSMSPRIEDGDLVLVKKQSALDNGNIGVFLVDGTDGLVKKIEYDQFHISLISFNTIYQPMVFLNEDMMRVAIIGKVVELKRVF